MAKDTFQHPVLVALRDAAVAYPGVSEGDSCVKRAFKVGKKGFLYLGEKSDEYNLMIKLGASIAEADTLGKSEDGDWNVGKFGWVTLKFKPDQRPPQGVLERWLDESYRLQASKKLLAELDGAD